MTESLLEKSERVLSDPAASSTLRESPLMAQGVIEEVAEGVAEISSFANVAAIDTGDGLALVDTGGFLVGSQVRDLLRTWRADAVQAAVYTHGHTDHCLGTAIFDAEAETNGRPRPRVIAHEAVNPRFERYCLTAGYNASINRRQFSLPDLQWPTEYRRPDDVYANHFETRVGDVTLQLHHARAETDDHTWVWIPERRVLCTGDLFIWCMPNVGNPQKVERYAREWAVALRTMAMLGAEVLLPGHGLPIAGSDRIHTVLTDTADLLDSLVEQTLVLMNAGVTLDEILHTVTVPAHLADKPYLQPVYDEPEFIVRNLWRLYGGWWDGNPAHLKPAPDATLAAEVASLAGGAEVLARRAEAVAATGDVRLAGDLIEMAGLAAPSDAEIHKTRARLLRERAHGETSLMAKGIYRAAAKDSEAIAEPGD